MMPFRVAMPNDVMHPTIDRQGTVCEIHADDTADQRAREIDASVARVATTRIPPSRSGTWRPRSQATAKAVAGQPTVRDESGAATCSAPAGWLGTGRVLVTPVFFCPEAPILRLI